MESGTMMRSSRGALIRAITLIFGSTIHKMIMGHNNLSVKDSVTLMVFYGTIGPTIKCLWRKADEGLVQN